MKPTPAAKAPTPPRQHAPAGTRVSVIRTRHGWYDGSVEGVLSDSNGSVLTDEGDTLVCEHPRDYTVLRS